MKDYIQLNPGILPWASKRILVLYSAGTRAIEVVNDHSPICFGELQVKFFIVMYLVLVKISV